MSVSLHDERDICLSIYRPTSLGLLYVYIHIYMQRFLGLSILLSPHSTHFLSLPVVTDISLLFFFLPSSFSLTQTHSPGCRYRVVEGSRLSLFVSLLLSSPVGMYVFPSYLQLPPSLAFFCLSSL